MNTRRLTALTAALVTLGLAGQALALDGYRDRKGMYYGVGIVGGSYTADVDGAESTLGVQFRGRIGGGINDRVTLDGELGWRLHTEERDLGLAKLEIGTDIVTAYVGANFFIFDGLYIRGMGGLAHMIVEATSSSPGFSSSDSDSETGLGLGVGLGYEFFATSDLAIGIGGDFQHLMFDEANANLINFGVHANWY